MSEESGPPSEDEKDRDDEIRRKTNPFKRKSVSPDFGPKLEDIEALRRRLAKMESEQSCNDQGEGQSESLI